MSSILLSLAITSCDTNKAVRAEYAGVDISDKASIVRDKNTKQASLIIDTDGKWALYAGPSADQINFEKAIATGENSGTFPLDGNDSTRTYFQLVTNDGKAILAERHLPMAGGYNFRDIGGIKTTDGKYVKWGKVLRSDELHNLTEADLNYLSSIPLISIVDFRANNEVEKAPDKNPVSLHKNYHLPISPGNLLSIESIVTLPEADMDSIMRNINKMLVTDSASIKQYKIFFELLQNEKDIPLMFHCSAGKDRTGMGAALFLYSLGVDEETILKDYLASNKYLGDKYTPIVSKYPNLKPLLEVRPQYIQAGIEEIKNKYGSIDNFLTKELKVDTLKMRELYLY